MCARCVRDVCACVRARVRNGEEKAAFKPRYYGINFRRQIWVTIARQY